MNDGFDPNAFVGAESSFDPKAFVSSGAAQSDSSHFMDAADNAWDGFWGSVGRYTKAVSEVPGVSNLFPAPADIREPVKTITGTLQKFVENEMGGPLGEMAAPANLTNILSAVSPLAKDTVKSMFDKNSSHITKDAAGFVAGVLTDPRTFMGLNDTNSSLLQIDSAAEQRAGEALAQGIELTPAQATQSRVLSLLEGFGNRYIFSTGTFDKFYGPQLEAWHAMAKNILSKFGDGPALDAVKEEGAHRIANYLNNVAPEDRAVMADLMGNSMGETISNLDVGQYQKSVIEQTTKKVRDAFNQRFAEIGKILPPENVIPVPEWKQAAAKVLEEQQSLTKTGMENKPLLSHAIKVTGKAPTPGKLILGGQEMPPVSSDMQKYLDNHPDIDPTPTPPPSYADIQANLRSYSDSIQQHDIAAKFGSNSKMMGDTISGSYKTLSSALRRDVANYVNDIGSKAQQVLKEAPPQDPEMLAQMQKMAEFPDQFNSVRQDYAASKKSFNDPTVTRWLTGKYQPGKITQDSLNNAGNVLDLLDPKDRVPIQQNVLTQLMTNSRTGTIDPGTFMNNVKKIGYPTLARVIPEEVLPEIAHSQSTLNAMGSAATMAAQPSETARGMMTAGASFKTLSGLIDLVSGNVAGATRTLARAAVLPNLIAKAYLSQPAREMLIKGLNFPSASGAALNLLRNGAVVGALTNAGRSRIDNLGNDKEASN